MLLVGAGAGGGVTVNSTVRALARPEIALNQFASNINFPPEPVFGVHYIPPNNASKNFSAGISRGDFY
jgi:hypothetical protein